MRLFLVTLVVALTCLFTNTNKAMAQDASVDASVDASIVPVCVAGVTTPDPMSAFCQYVCNAKGQWTTYPQYKTGKNCCSTISGRDPLGNCPGTAYLCCKNGRTTGKWYCDYNGTGCK